VSGHMYFAMWPILDLDRTLSELKAEACAGLDAMATGDGAWLEGEPQWLVSGDRLVCWAPARPWDELASVTPIRRGGNPLTPEKVREIQRLAEQRLPDARIAEIVRADRRTVRRYRTEAA
jgi:hypothetical protein